MTKQLQKGDILSEKIFLDALMTKPDFATRTIKHVASTIFREITEPQRVAINILSLFYEEYQRHPTKLELSNYLEKTSAEDNGSKDDNLMDTVNFIHNVEEPDVELDYLLEEFEGFLKERSRLMTTMLHYGKDKKDRKAYSIEEPEYQRLMAEVDAISFDNGAGSSLFDDFDDFLDDLEENEKRVPFNIPILNDITDGGLPSNSLTVILAGTGVGKSLAMCSFAADNVRNGKNVMYFSMEMSMSAVSSRVAANLFDVPVSDLKTVGRDFLRKKKIAYDQDFPDRGDIKVKQFAPGSATPKDFMNAISEAKKIDGFEPDIIYVDYLGICASTKSSSASNQYSTYKAVAEELRGLSMELDVPVVTAGQINRSGYDKDIEKDIDLPDVSESGGIGHTADFIFVLRSTEELESNKTIMVQQVKNRWSSMQHNKRFALGLDRSIMKLRDNDAPLAQPTTITTNNKIDFSKFIK